MREREAIEWVESQLVRHPWLRRPRHILVIDEPIVLSLEERKVYFSGVQPGWLKDTVIVSWPLRKEDTLVHEIIHTYGLGEEAAWTIAPALVRLRRSIPPLVKREARYEVCRGEGCPFRELHERLGNRLIHLVRVS